MLLAQCACIYAARLLKIAYFFKNPWSSILRTLQSIFLYHFLSKLHYERRNWRRYVGDCAARFHPTSDTTRQKCVTFLRCKIRNSSWISREFSCDLQKMIIKKDYTTTAASFRILAEKLQKNDGVHALIEKFSFRKTVIIHQAPFLRLGGKITL